MSTIPLRLLTQTVSIVTAGTTTTVDTEGNPTRAAAATTTVPARLERAGGFIDGTSETADGPVISTTDWLLILAPAVVIGQHDQVTVDGVRFEVVGPPVQQRTPAGVHHIEARLRQVS
jgi:hypothetical protein